MTTPRIWHALVYLGDGALLIPCTLLLFAWLMTARATRRTAWCWLAAVILLGGGVALSKMVYMVSGWHPAGWNFIGLSGHAASSFLFWPAAAMLVSGRHRTGLRIAAIALAAVLALAISASSWLSNDHSLSEVVLGAGWGVVIATVFVTMTWRQVVEAPPAGNWMVASLLLLMLFAVGREFPSTRTLSRMALQLSGHTAIHTRTDLGPQAQLSKREVQGRNPDSSAANTQTPL